MHVKCLGLMAAGIVLTAGFAGCSRQGRCVQDVCLADGGRTDWVIAVSPQATPTDMLAAEELKLHLEESTGAMFEIVSNATDGVRAIEIGTDKARQIVGEARSAALQPEESVYVCRDGRLAIVGGGATGNAYGVYSFLEREIGCRWFAATGEKLVPKHSRLVIGQRDVTERPAMKARKILCTGRTQRKDSSDSLFYFRNRINEIDENFGNVYRKDLKGKIVSRIRDYGPGCHSLFKHIPPDKFFKAHPEWFTMNADGKRVPDRQLCFSNRQLRDELTKRFIAYVGSFSGGNGSFDLSAMDVVGEFCKCDGCQALVRKYDTPGGPFFDYLLELSPKLREKFPDAILHFLVYRKEQTQFPPKGVARFPDNLVAVFAPINNDLSKDYLAEENKGTYEDMRRWCEIAEVWHWYYPQLYGPTGAPIKPPYGGLKRMAVDTLLSAKAGISGGWYEHDVGTKHGFNFSDVLMWMIARYYIDPTQDWRALRKEFFDNMYAEASEDMSGFDDLLEAEREKSGWAHWNDSVEGFLTPAKIVELQALFDRMEKKVGDKADVIQRIREVRTGVDFMAIRRYKRICAEVGSSAISVDAVFDRLTNTVVRAVARRNDLPLPCEVENRKTLLSVIPRIAAEFELAKVQVKPLPGDMGNLPEDRVIQLFPGPEDDNHYKRRVGVTLSTMPDAAIGKVLVEDEREDRLPVPYKVGLYDRDGKKSLLDVAIKPQDIKVGEFALYRMGLSSIPSSKCQLWIGRSWNLSKLCSIAYVAGERPEYDIYISLKFVGPKFGGAASEKSAVYFDRLVFVKTGKTR